MISDKTLEILEVIAKKDKNVKIISAKDLRLREIKDVDIVIVDEAHSSQTGSAALKLKTALADTDDALKEYAELLGI